MNSHSIRIATRASRLALWQANHVADRLRAANDGLSIELVEVSTSGDRDQTEPLRAFGGLGVFTREVQRAVLEGRADLAVHSLKDLPTDSVAGLQLACVPRRASVNDVLVLPVTAKPRNFGIADLSRDSRIGTGSPRRQAQLRHLNIGLELLEIRGNVETRLKKLDAGDYDALILAEAGLDRLGLSDRVSLRLMPPEMFPAVGQGALGIECRQGDDRTSECLASIDDPVTHAAVRAERALLATLRAGCHAPVGVSTVVDADELTLQAVLLNLEGTRRLEQTASGSLQEPEAVGNDVADRLLADGGEGLIRPAVAPS
jgi:hydroxymethylbilane synthase